MTEEPKTWICVLNDDETWTALDGCYIALATEGELEKLEDMAIGEKIVDIPLKQIWPLKDLVQLAIERGLIIEG